MAYSSFGSLPTGGQQPINPALAGNAAAAGFGGAIAQEDLSPDAYRERIGHPSQVAGQEASNTQPKNASIVQNQQVNLPSLPPPSNLQMTGATMTPNGYDATYGEGAGVAANRGYDLESKARQETARLQAEQDAHRAALADASRRSAMSAFSSATGAGMPVNQPSEAELQDAARNQYALAKDRVGQRSGAALRQFQEIMSSRGLGGSTIEGEGAGHIFGGANDELGAVDVGQAIDAITRKRQVADQATQLNAQQKQQQLSMLSSLFSSNGSLY